MTIYLHAERAPSRAPLYAEPPAGIIITYDAACGVWTAADAMDGRPLLYLHHQAQAERMATWLAERGHAVVWHFAADDGEGDG